MKVRLIIASAPNGEGEEMTWTEDFGAPVEDFLPSGHTVDHDAIIEADLPFAFPLDSTFEKQAP